MEWLVIGLSVGTVLALTGAGGAILAIPLFMTLLEMSLIEATTASLIVVALSALIGATTQTGKVNFKIVLILFLASTFGAWAALPLKLLLPTLVLKLLLAALSLYSLSVMWRPTNTSSNFTRALWPQIPGGFILGALTTLTGLGGGVILLPWLKLTTGKLDIVTSLTTIAFISTFSLVMQVSKGASFPQWVSLAQVIVGIIAATFIVKYMVKKLSEKMILRIRLYTFTAVVAFTLITLFGKNS